MLPHLTVANVAGRMSYVSFAKRWQVLRNHLWVRKKCLLYNTKILGCFPSRAKIQTALSF